MSTQTPLFEDEREKRQYVKSGEYSIISGPLRCELCECECKSLRSLEAHLRLAHKFGHDNVKYEEYYNKYLKRESDGTCVVCGAPTKQHKFRYDKCCCIAHARSYAGKRARAESWDLTGYDRIFERQIREGLRIAVTKEEMHKELSYFRRSPGTLAAMPNHNKIMLYFQQDNFYAEEKRIFSENPEARKKLIENRIKYKFKPAEELSDTELLNGFKISGMHRSYSHFSPLWTKYFAEKYKVKKCADPFGGWGDHMLGFYAAGCGYVYNDLSESTCEGVRNMVNWLGADYGVTCGDAAEFEIPDDCDAVFMCPPYYNTEVYECGKFASYAEFEKTLRSVFYKWKESPAVTLGVIIRSDFEKSFPDMGVPFTKEAVNDARCHFNKDGKMKEYLYVYRK